jgi:hypothetical protein
MSTDIPEPRRPLPGRMQFNTVTVVAGAALVIVLIVAAVALALAGWKTEAIIGLLVAVGGPAGGLLLILERLAETERETARQTPVIRTIEKATNGDLDRRIQEGAERAALIVLERVLNAPTTVVPPIAERETQ